MLLTDEAKMTVRPLPSRCKTEANMLLIFFFSKVWTTNLKQNKCLLHIQIQRMYLNSVLGVAAGLPVTLIIFTLRHV